MVHSLAALALPSRSAWLGLCAGLLTVVACEGDRPKCRPSSCGYHDASIAEDDGTPGESEPDASDEGDASRIEADAGACELDLRVDDCPTCIESKNITRTVADDCTCGPRQWACVTARGDTASGEPALYYSAALDQVFYLGQQGSVQGLLLCDSLQNAPPACACDDRDCE